VELSEIIPHIEAFNFASDKPLSNEEIVELEMRFVLLKTGYT
jgi:hypothetical protein